MKDRAISCGNDDLAILWKVHSESQLIYNSKIGMMEHISVLNPKVFMACGEDSGICLWSANKRTPQLVELHLHEAEAILSMDCIWGSDIISTGSYDGKVNIWSIDKEYKKLKKLWSLDMNGSINDMKWANNRLYLVQSREQKYGRWKVFPDVDESCLLYTSPSPRDS